MRCDCLCRPRFGIQEVTCPFASLFFERSPICISNSTVQCHSRMRSPWKLPVNVVSKDVQEMINIEQELDNSTQPVIGWISSCVRGFPVVQQRQFPMVQIRGESTCAVHGQGCWHARCCAMIGAVVQTVQNPWRCCTLTNSSTSWLCRLFRFHSCRSDTRQSTRSLRSRL